MDANDQVYSLSAVRIGFKVPFASIEVFLIEVEAAAEQHIQTVFPRT